MGKTLKRSAEGFCTPLDIKKYIFDSIQINLLHNLVLLVAIFLCQFLYAWLKNLKGLNCCRKIDFFESNYSFGLNGQLLVIFFLKN